MCGISGILTARSFDEAEISGTLDAITHRGPDDRGVWIDRAAGVGFGHLRLAIVDLTAAGHEPMFSASGRLVITFNGEIYNHGEIRDRLEEEGRAPEGGWRGHSDIETFLEAIDHWGLERALERAVGMFAFGLWDRQHQSLRLVRDRFGEKPLYYGWVGKDLVFASELKAIRAVTGFNNEIDPGAVAAFASRGYIPAPLSIYRRIYKLEPGCIATLDRSACKSPMDEAPFPGASSGPVTVARYWSYREVVEEGLADQFRSEGEALVAIEEALSRSISGQALADVPVGAFLSGGIDSSLVTAFYQRNSNRPIQTFSIGFEEAGFNEAEHAKAVADHLGTVHHEHYVRVAEARDVIPLLPQIYDEPFADSSQIPTFLVSRFAKEKVTVALTGDGGDELFGGYNRHRLVPRLWQMIRWVPRPLRAAMLLPMTALPASAWGRFAAFAAPSSPDFAAKIRKAAFIGARSSSIDDVLRAFLDEWPFSQSPVKGGDNHAFGVHIGLDRQVDGPRRLMTYDALSYLPDDILCKVDRASMATSLETRVPFLDHRLAAVAARVPSRMNIAGRSGKLLLRELLYREVPRAIVDRPKAGFGIPVGQWLRGPLREWAEDLLSVSSLESTGLFDVDVVRQRWAGHLEGRDSTQALWSILMFQAWHASNSSI